MSGVNSDFTSRRRIDVVHGRVASCGGLFCFPSDHSHRESSRSARITDTLAVTVGAFTRLGDTGDGNRSRGPRAAGGSVCGTGFG